jgi:hypothetical protein
VGLAGGGGKSFRATNGQANKAAKSRMTMIKSCFFMSKRPLAGPIRFEEDKPYQDSGINCNPRIDSSGAGSTPPVFSPVYLCLIVLFVCISLEFGAWILEFLAEDSFLSLLFHDATLRHRVHPAGMKGVALGQARQAQPQPFQPAVLAHRFQEILRTGRVETAAGTQERGNEHLVTADKKNQQQFHGARCSPQITDDPNAGCSPQPKKTSNIQHSTSNIEVKNKPIEKFLIPSTFLLKMFSAKLSYVLTERSQLWL